MYRCIKLISTEMKFINKFCHILSSPVATDGGTMLKKKIYMDLHGTRSRCGGVSSSWFPRLLTENVDIWHE